MSKFVILVLAVVAPLALSFAPLQSLFGFDSTSLRRPSRVWRDRSASYWFQEGDKVRVVEDVTRQGVNLRDREGVVLSTWEKCEVDPHCCCAEHVDPNMAVHVKFEDESERKFFDYHFAEEELSKVSNEGESGD